VVAAIHLNQFADVCLAFTPLAMGTAAPVALPLAVGDEPAAQGFGVEAQRVVFGQHLGGQGGAEACPPWWVVVVLAHQGQGVEANLVRFAMRGGSSAQPMHQAAVTLGLVAFPNAFALAIGQRQQGRHLHQA